MDSSTMNEENVRRSARVRKTVEPLSYDVLIDKRAAYKTPTNTSNKKLKLNKTHSASTPLCESSHLVSPSPNAKKFKSQSLSLEQLTVKFKEKILNSRDNTYLIQRTDGSLGAPNRRIYDVVNVMEGVGMLERIPSTSQVRWVGPVLPQHKIKRLVKRVQIDNERKEAESIQLDNWIDSLQEMSSSQRMAGMLYCGQSHFQQVAHESQTSLILSAQSKVTLKVRSNKGSKNTPPANHDHSLRARVPENSLPPKAFLMESSDGLLRPLHLTNPPLLTQCASDFTWNQLPQFDVAQSGITTSSTATTHSSSTCGAFSPSDSKASPIIAPHSLRFDEKEY